jgi:hypothetical protein
MGTGAAEAVHAACLRRAGDRARRGLAPSGPRRPFDECLVDGERGAPQPGGFYGGWIAGDLAEPFKGVPGSRFR